MNLSFDGTVHLAELVAVVTIAWKANRAFNRFLDMLKDFPLHRHVDGISYPVGWAPPPIEVLPAAGGSASGGKKGGR